MEMQGYDVVKVTVDVTKPIAELDLDRQLVTLHDRRGQQRITVGF